MKLRRFLSVLLTLVLLVPMLSACRPKAQKEAFSVPEAFDTTTPIEITFWAKNDTNKTQTAIYQKAIDDFESLYPNVTVNIRLYTDYGKIYNDVITNIPTKTTPNVCITYPDHIATYMTGQNTVVPLDDLFSDPSYGLGGDKLLFDSPTEEEIIPQFLNECKVNGSHVAIPFMRSTEACYINKTFVEKLGYEVPDVVTWDFIWEVSEAAMEKTADGLYAVNGQNVLIPFIYKSTDNMMIQMLRQKDAGYSTPEGAIEIKNDTTTALLKTIGEHAKSGAFSTFKISSYPANFLNAGQCLFAIDSTAGATWMGTDAPLTDISEDKLVRFETAVRPIPQFDPESPKMISQGPSICIFNKEDPQIVLASWLFAQFLLTNDVQTAYAETEGYIPVTFKAQNSEEYTDYLSREGEDNQLHYNVKIEASKLLLAHTEDTFTTPVFNGSASLRDAAGALIENTVKSQRRNQTVDDAYFNKLYDDVFTLYHLDSISSSGTGQEKQDLGPLPSTAVWLLSLLGFAWFLIALFFVLGKIKEKRSKKG